VLSAIRVFANVRAGRSATAGIEPAQTSIILSENLP
jgi:hypothetical protein